VRDSGHALLRALRRRGGGQQWYFRTACASMTAIGSRERSTLYSEGCAMVTPPRGGEAPVCCFSLSFAIFFHPSFRPCGFAVESVVGEGLKATYSHKGLVQAVPEGLWIQPQSPLRRGVPTPPPPPQVKFDLHRLQFEEVMARPRGAAALGPGALAGNRSR